MPDEQPPTTKLDRAVMATTIASALGMLLAIARSKTTALVMGPDGLGQVAEINQVLSVVFVPFGIINGVALVRSVGQVRGDPAALQRVYDSFASLVMAAGVVLVPVATVAVFVIFDGRVPPDAAMLALFGALTAVLGTLFALPSQWMMAVGRSHEYAVTATWLSIGGAASVVLGTWGWGVRGQYVGGLIGVVLVGIAGRPFYRRWLSDLRLWPKWVLEASIVKDVLVLGTTSMIAQVTVQSGLSAIRWSLQSVGGDAANGQFQAAWSVASIYFGSVLAGLGTVFFPRFSTAKDAVELEKEMQGAMSMVLRNAPPLILLAIAVRVPLIHGLYSSRFDVAAQMVGFQMAGDLGKAVSWVQAGPLLYRGKVKAFLLSELLGMLLLAGFAIALAPALGVMGASVGYALGYGCYVVLTKPITERACGVKLSWRPVWLTLAFGATCLGLAFLTMDSWEWSVAVGIVSGIWALRQGLFEPVFNKVARLRALLQR
jgi:O-antigen/teichoic acid export membrane protein